MGNWQKIFESPKLIRAEIVKSVLNGHGITTFLMNKKDTMYQIGNFEVLVKNHDVLKSIKIIENEINFE